MADLVKADGAVMLFEKLCFLVCADREHMNPLPASTVANNGCLGSGFLPVDSPKGEFLLRQRSVDCNLESHAFGENLTGSVGRSHLASITSSGGSRLNVLERKTSVDDKVIEADTGCA